MKIAIIGAGNGGRKLLKLFFESENTEVALVVDRSEDSEGIIYAKKLGIQTSTTYEYLPDDIDLIVEATGVKKVYEDIDRLYRNSKKIICSDIAKLIIKTIDSNNEMSVKLNTQLEMINNTTNTLENEVIKVIDTTKILNKSSELLINSSEESKSNIEETNNLIESINKISQQIRILGLNANIEAARSGEHGKGFSVVATEIQKLSDSTFTFAKEISNLLESLSSENTKISDEILNLKKIAVDQNIIFDSVNQALNQLVDEVSK